VAVAAPDTLSPPPERTLGPRSEFDFTSGDFTAPRSPSRILAGGSAAGSRWRAEPDGFFEKVLKLVRKAFGK
jgi:hypothetical protein